MKVQESLIQYLYETKKLSLSGIGHFTLSQNQHTYEKSDASSVQHSIQFIQDTSFKDDPDLITFLVKTTGKMRPLAISDLESFLSTGIQLLNIGKPFVITGIGSLFRMRDQIYFTPGNLTAPKIEDKLPDHKLKDKTTEEQNLAPADTEFDYSTPSKKTPFTWVIMLAALLMIFLVGWGIYYFLISSNNQNNTTYSTEDAIAKINSTDSSFIQDSLQKMSDNVPVNTPSIAAIPNDIKYNYAIELREYKFLKNATERAVLLKNYGHNVFVETKDETHHCLLFPIVGPLADSSKVIDSLKLLLLPPTSKRPQVRLKQ
ncbi:MAG TPA: hypothetical protein VFN30_08120 [Chitinophagaceae bacterium]|nr:hypothetical protein [Chitinophagaceae bacterium]